MRSSALIALAIATGFAVVAWANAEKTLVYCSEASPSTFNPQMADDGPTFNAASQMLYNRLVEFAPGGTAVVPGLATGWSITDHGRTYTFDLRENVQFHTTATFKPTRAMNADDVLFSFARAMDRANPYHAVGGGNYSFFSGMGFEQLISRFEKLGDHKIRVRLTRPEAPFLADLAMSFAVVLSKEYADRMLAAGTPERVDLDPVGTGPFILKRYRKDTQIRYDAHPTYWAGRPKLDHVVFSITPDANVRMQKLRAGECDLVGEPSPQDVQALKKHPHPRFDLVERAGANIGYLALNVTKPPFDRREVRRAVAMALNRQLYIDSVYRGLASLPRGPIPPTVWGSDPEAPALEYDVERARALLVKAGFADGFDTDLWTLPVSRPYNPNGKKMGELMQADLAKIGVRVRLLTYDWTTYLAKARLGEPPMVQLGWTTDNGDPDNFLAPLLSCAAVADGGNAARWCDPEFDRLLGDAKLVTDRKARSAIYVRALRRVMGEVAWVPLAHATVYRGLARGLKNYVLNPLGVEDFFPLELGP